MEEIEDKLQNSQGNFIIRLFGPGIRMRGNVENGINLDIDQLIDGAVEEIEMIDLSEAATSDLKAEMEMLKKRLAGMEKKLKALKKSGGEK